MPKDMTAEKVIERYIEAMGGRDQINNISDVKQTASVSMGPQTIVIQTYRKQPNKMTSRTLLNGNVMQEQVFNGKEGSVTGMGQTQELAGEQLETMKFQARMHKFLRYEDLGVDISLEGTEAVDGDPAYKIKVTNPDGMVRYDYYDVGSGLRVKTKQTVQGPQGEVTQSQTYSDYREVMGVKFPYRIDISGIRSMTMKVDSIQVNEGIEDKVFQ